MTKDICGIYVGRCLVHGKVYVGSSIDWLRRVEDHVAALLYQRHPNRYLQRSWDKHGAHNFVWGLLEPVEDEDNLLNREQHWINELRSADPEYGYNIAYPVRQRMPSKRMSQIHKDYWGSLTEEEYKERISYCDDPKFRELIASIRTTPEYRKNLSDKAIARWSDSEFKERLREILRKASEDTELRKLRSINANRLWEDPKHREAMSNIRAKRWEDKAYAEERKNGTTELWKDAEYRRKVSEAVKKGCNNPEYIAKLRERVRQQHAKKRRQRRERLEALSARLLRCKPRFGQLELI